MMVPGVYYERTRGYGNSCVFLSIISFSGCINTGVPKITPYYEDQNKSGKYNNFYADTKNVIVYAWADSPEVIDHFESACFHENYDGSYIKYVEHDPGAGWKFITFDVTLRNNISNSSLKFKPNFLEDTDKLLYRNNQLLNYYKLCGSDLVPSKGENLDTKVKQKDSTSFSLFYKIPSSSVPDKFYYSIRAVNYSWSDSGELDLR